MKITIFTPSYNRAYIIRRLYESIVSQKYREIEWLIIDDCSTDGTTDLVRQWVKEPILGDMGFSGYSVSGEFLIRYFRFEERHGLPACINEGISRALTPVFFWVSSDDYLLPGAIKEVTDKWMAIDGDESLSGLIAPAKPIRGEAILIPQTPTCDRFTLRQLWDMGMRRESVMIFKTSILKMLHLPEFSGEYYLPIGYLYNLIDDTDCKMLVLTKSLYVFEYQNDGISMNRKLLKTGNYFSWATACNQKLKYDITLKNRFKISGVYEAYAMMTKLFPNHNNGYLPIVNKNSPVMSLVAFPAAIGYLLTVLIPARLKHIGWKFPMKVRKHLCERMFQGRMRYIWLNERSDELVVVFTGLNKNTSWYHHFGLLYKSKVDKLFIRDDFGYLGSYYWFDKGSDIPEKLTCGVINKVLAKRNYSKITMIGTSKGGSSALYYGLLFGASEVIAGVSWYRVGTHLKNFLDGAVLQAMMGDKSRESVSILDEKLQKMIESCTGSKTIVNLLYSDREKTYSEYLELVDCLSQCKVIHKDFIYSFTTHNGVVPYFNKLLKEKFF